MTDPALQALLDKLQIAEFLTRYLRSVDRGDVDTLRSCYLPGATEDHGGLFAGPAQDYVDSIAPALTHPRSRPRLRPPLTRAPAPSPFGIMIG
jgi:SnoaL-like protein